MGKSKLQEVLKRIEAKLELEMKVTDYEWAMYVLYRNGKGLKNGVE